MFNREKHEELTILPEQTIVLQNVQNATHLAEYQYPRTLLLHRCEELVKDDHLPRVLDEVLISCVWWAGFLEA